MLKQLLKCETKLFLRNFINAFFCLIFPPVMIILFGSIYGNEANQVYMGRGMVDVSVPAYFALIIAVTAFMSVPMTLSEYREKKVLKRYRTTALSECDILISIFAINFLTTIIGMVLLFLTAKIKYGVKFEGNSFEFTVSLLLSICAMYSFGLLLSNIARNIKNTNTLCYCIFFPMLFLSGATIPKEIFPENVSTISKVIPLSHVVELLKFTWLGSELQEDWTSIVFLLITLIVCLILNYVFFKWE